MKLTAIFESWHIGDGNYPPLSRGQKVNLSFELEPRKIETVSLDTAESFHSLGNGDYRFCASVIKVYRELLVFQSGDFRFYVMANDKARYEAGSQCCGTGTLMLDHDFWVENLVKYEEPPNLFYDLQVTRILKVNLPERFVARHDSGKSFPTRLTQGDYSATDVEEVETMEGQPFDEEFYILELDNSGLEGRVIPRTFLS